MVFGVSGAAALGYQSIWLRVLIAGLGSEASSMLTVLTAVMAGMGIGAWALDGVVSRSARPGRWFAGMEAVMGLWGAILALVLPWLGRGGAGLLGLEPSLGGRVLVEFGLPLLVLLPSTVAMGASLPALERWVASGPGGGRWVGAVYGAQVLGAALGTLAAVWWLMPLCGLRGAALVLAGVNAVCGGMIGWWENRTHREISVHREGAGEQRGRAAIDGTRRRQWMVVVGVAGILGMGFEVVGIRLLSQVLANTVYSYAAVLAVYLIGTSLGAFVYQRIAGWAAARRGAVLSSMLAALSVSVAISLAAFRSMGWVSRRVGESVGESSVAAGVIDVIVAAWVFGVPTFLMGSVFSHVAQQLRGRQGGVGAALGMNALGAALGPVGFGLLTLPAVGARWSLALVGVGYAILGVWVSSGTREAWGRWASWGSLGLVVTAAWALPLRILEMPPGSSVLSYRETADAFVAVTEERGYRVLRVDNRFQMGGSAAAEAQARQAHLPLRLHGQAHRALFLGVGTGGTLRTAQRYHGLEVTGVELLSGVVDVLGAFADVSAAADREIVGRIVVADARRFVALAEDQYDVIVADLFHPARDGAGLLYTREQFSAIRNRLAPGGLFCQWLPLHQLNAASLGSIVRTFVEVFPEAELWWLHFSVEVPVVALMGYAGQTPPDAEALEDRLRRNGVEGLKDVGLDDPVRFLGLRVLGRAGLDRVAVGGALSTDDRPVVLFAAPGVRSEAAGQAYARVRRLIELSADASVRASDPGWSGTTNGGRRRAAYQRARDAYLLGLLAEGEGRDGEAVDAWVQSVRWSPDFNAGYARCLSRATVMFSSQPEETRRLLEALAEARPATPVARQLLDRLEADAGR